MTEDAGHDKVNDHVQKTQLNQPLESPTCENGVQETTSLNRSQDEGKEATQVSSSAPKRLQERRHSTRACRRTAHQHEHDFDTDTFKLNFSSLDASCTNVPTRPPKDA